MFHHAQSLALLLCAFLLTPAGCFAQVAYGYGETSEIIITTEGPMRTRGIRNRTNKDFVIGGVFGVHEDAGGVVCGMAQRDQWVEAMLLAIDSVNANESLLPNITLGFDIRDSCYSENIGLDEAIDVIISGNQLEVAGCQSTNVGSPNTSIPTVGIVGAAASRVSIPVASLGRLFQVPQVSYGSTSPILSNRETYSYFYRTVSPDNLQAQAIIDIVRHFNWTHISILYIGDSYGQPGARELRILAEANNICIDVDKEIGVNFVAENYTRLASTLLASKAEVVIVFALEQNVRLLLRELEAATVANSSSYRRFTWIASDAWARSLDLVHEFSETVAGYFGVAPLAPHVPLFDEYFSQLRVQTNRRNAWFEDIYSAFMPCNASNCDQNVSITSLPNYAQDSFVPPMVDAVYAFANALHDFLEENCNFTSGWTWENQRCPGQKRELNGSTLRQYLGSVDFISPLTGNRVTFDSLGSVAGIYEVVNYQALLSSGDTQFEYEYQQVGMWSNFRMNSSGTESLKVFDNVTLQFGLNESDDIIFQPPITQCGRCSLGEYRRTADSCCGICDPCLGRNYSNDPTATSCKTCPISNFTWGNNPTEGSSYCVPIPETFFMFNNPWSIVLIILAILGLLGVITATVVFAIYWNTPVIKSSGREQMVLLLIGITLSFIMPFIFISPPVVGVCVLQYIGLWLALPLMFGALLVKIVRVARIFFNKTTLTHLRFTEFYYQILFTLLLVLGQMIIVAAAIAYRVPSVQRDLRLNTEDNNRLPEVVVTCANNPLPLPFAIISILYESAILAAATILGVLSFKYPANFNEAKYVSFCTFAVVVIWVAFIITYLAIQSMQEIQNAIIALGIVMTAFTVLITIFGRKVLIVVFWPEKNVATLTTQHGRSRADHNSVGNEHNVTTLKLNNLESSCTDAQGYKNGRQKGKQSLVSVLCNNTSMFIIKCCTVDREIFTSKIIHIKNFRVDKFSRFIQSA